METTTVTAVTVVYLCMYAPHGETVKQEEGIGNKKRTLN